MLRCDGGIRCSGFVAGFIGSPSMNFLNAQALDDVVFDLFKAVSFDSDSGKCIWLTSRIWLIAARDSVT